jgi:hypothetical protein
MSTATPRYPLDEFARRGDAIYEKEVLPRLEAGDNDKFVAIDIETGAYEVDPNELGASHRLRDRIPDAQIWMRRVGSRYVHHFGGRFTSVSPSSA